jgi:hypothetical protein
MEKITSKPRTRTRKVVHEEPLAEFEKELANTVATETPESAPVPCDTPSERSTAMTEMMEQPQVTTGYAVQIGNAGATVKTGMVSSLRGIDEIEAEIVTLVRNTVSNSMRASGAVTQEGIATVRDVVKGAISATEEVGAGLVLSSKSVAKGVVMGMADVGGDVIGAATETARSAVKGAAEVGGDVAMVARRTLEGAVEAAQEIGGNVGDIAVATAKGAVESAGTVGNAAVSTVRDMLVGVAGGFKDVASAILPKAPPPPEQA